MRNFHFYYHEIIKPWLICPNFRFPLFIYIIVEIIENLVWQQSELKFFFDLPFISEQKNIKQGTTSTQRNDLIRTIIWLTASFIWNTIWAYHLPVRMHVVYTHVLHKTGEALVEPKVIPPRWRHKVTEPLKKTKIFEFKTFL